MSSLNKISVAGRTSPLSQVQIQEVLEELRRHIPGIEFDVTQVTTTGDKDLATSLRTLDKTDFFTKEVDNLVLAGACDVGIHSAKDLPAKLARGLVLVCLTKGIDPSDSLVMRPGETLDSLRSGSVIATSSVRREEVIRQIRQDLIFRDLRGTIGQRLELLETGEADGVVVAEAALIRLGLLHLNRCRLPGPTVEGQGQLAIIARENDHTMRQLFAVIDSR